ncbi:hypothetical protein SPONL_2001 [uncultured Candidatus Thioglobus sp.]|nr:hypothetical protein SPONL_2001 [uncultured Candidatus Thioglobus sp.]
MLDVGPDPVSVSFKGLDYNTVFEPITEVIWLDRNLGASRVCTALTDSACYGDLYQWGRNTTDFTPSTTNDWTTADATSAARAAAWSDSTSGAICPVGYRVPSVDEFRTLSLPWVNPSIANNNATLFAFNSALKLPTTGFKEADGTLNNTVPPINLWASNIFNDPSLHATYLYILDSTGVFLGHRIGVPRVFGYSVRCIQGTSSGSSVTAGVTNSETNITLSEDSTGFYTVTLNRHIVNGTVVITPRSENTTAATVSGALTFDKFNWNIPQTITVFGVEDDNTTNDDVTITYTVAGENYNNITVVNVTATVTDNDTPSVAVSAVSGNTTEAGGTATFTIRLNTAPSNDVAIPLLSSSDTSEGTVSPSSITFTTSNWDTEQTITVTGVNDGDLDGNITYSIITDAVTSVDTNYRAINPDDVSVINIDNNAAPMTFEGVDSISYPAVRIGNQIWTSESMRHDSGIFGESSSYNNDAANDANGFGKLYNWEAAMGGAIHEGAQGICANGWHIPTSAEWTTLTTYLGGENTATYNKLIVGGTSGFNAQESGRRSDDGTFSSSRINTFIWSSSFDQNNIDANQFQIIASSRTVGQEMLNKNYGLSVRCILGSAIPVGISP